MNQKVRTFLFNISGLLILAGAILYFIHWIAAPYLFAIGAAGYTVCYLTISVKEMDFRSRRLHRFNVISGILMVFASGFMFKDRTEWILCLTIAAILQVYTAFVSPKSKQ
ncbi:hypothetical protein [Parabacteroides bouchesdurhonensis]|uniref:hypothetical protein n=1 Tax=Parabacteroides bouchesdurhonensis TaxID=1936995 RepID=UPI000C843588|nr:hypothetical protein [Parabacteroides bouchesdurhonensis]